jgi:probable rRNA maturation factor
VNREVVRQAVIRVLEGQKIHEIVEVEVSVVGERKMSQLHEKYLETKEATDVMSFPLEFDPSTGSGFLRYPDGITRLGDIVICYPVVVREAASRGVRIDDEVARLVEHGCLHLLGIHHD